MILICISLGSKKSQGETYVPQFTVSEMAESTDDDSIMVSKSQEYNIKHYSDSMINTSNQVSSERGGLQALQLPAMFPSEFSGHGVKGTEPLNSVLHGVFPMDDVRGVQLSSKLYMYIQ